MRPKGSLSRRSTFLLMVMIVAVSTIIGTTYTLWRLRAEAINRQLESAAMYARAFEDHLTQSFNVIDLTLANVVNENQTTVTLADALRRAPYLLSLSLLDTRCCTDAGEVEVAPIPEGPMLPRLKYGRSSGVRHPVCG